MGNKLYQNIKILAKSKNIKLGDLEKEVGVSAGYFSREPENPLLIPMTKVAEKFGTNINALLYDDVGINLQIQAIDEEIAELQKKRTLLVLQCGGVV